MTCRLVGARYYLSQYRHVFNIIFSKILINNQNIPPRYSCQRIACKITRFLFTLHCTRSMHIRDYNLLITQFIKLHVLSTKHHGLPVNSHYGDVIMSAMASQINSPTIACSTINSGAKLRVTDLCAGNPPVNGEIPAKGPVTRKIFPFDDVIMKSSCFAGKLLSKCPSRSRKIWFHF